MFRDSTCPFTRLAFLTGSDHAFLRLTPNPAFHAGDAIVLRVFSSPPGPPPQSPHSPPQPHAPPPAAPVLADYYELVPGENWYLPSNTGGSTNDGTTTRVCYAASSQYATSENTCETRMPTGLGYSAANVYWDQVTSHAKGLREVWLVPR